MFQDPITSFIEQLYVSANFDEAQSRLKECAAVMDSDFFLSNSEEDFMKHARLYVFESYCRIHERIDLSMLAKKLNMEPVRPSLLSHPTVLMPFTSRRLVPSTSRLRLLLCPSPSARSEYTHPRFFSFPFLFSHVSFDTHTLLFSPFQIAAEKWIVKMVSDAQLNAKIDSQSGHVILGLEPPDVYQQVGR
mgnify:CR=1 FL=1|jgi:hypothetical protein